MCECIHMYVCIHLYYVNWKHLLLVWCENRSFILWFLLGMYWYLNDVTYYIIVYQLRHNNCRFSIYIQLKYKPFGTNFINPSTTIYTQCLHIINFYLFSKNIWLKCYKNMVNSHAVTYVIFFNSVGVLRNIFPLKRQYDILIIIY